MSLIPPNGVPSSGTNKESLLSAKTQLISYLRQNHVPPAIIGKDRKIAAYHALPRKRVEFLLRESQIIDKDPDPFTMNFTGTAYLGPDDTERIDLIISPVVILQSILALEELDRKAIADVLVGRAFDERQTALSAKGALALPGALRPAVEDECHFLKNLFERIVRGEPRA